MISLISQAEVVRDLLSTETITVIGLLLGVCALLIYHIIQLNKKHDKEKAELRQDIKDAHAKLDVEYNSSTQEIKSIIEKYYTLATKVLEKLNTVL